MNAPAILDLNQLNRTTLNDPGFRDEILTLVQTELGRQLAALETASDAKSWVIAAHSLKGAALSIGGNDLAAVAKAAEQSTWSADASRSHCAAVSGAVSRLNGEIARLLKR